MKNASKIYFPGLNALRFIAASLVIFHHVEQYKHWAKLDNSWGMPVVDSLGHMSVSFFFVLSGFLITYLLLAEEQKTGKIALGKFYMRRLLRIWPLYFVIVALSGLTIFFFQRTGFQEMQINYSMTAVACLIFFLPNLLRIMNPTIIGANQLWSVGIEEQFYAVWPILIGRYVNHMFRFLGWFIGLKLVIHVLLMVGVGMTQSAGLDKVLRLYALFPVEQMALGGIGASLLFHGKQSLLSFLRQWPVLLASVLLITLMAFSGSHLFLMTYFQGVLFTIILINVIHHQWIYQWLEFKAMKHLGDISYGIYMWHTIIIAFLISIFKMAGLEFTFWINITLHSFSFLLTLAVAHLSFRYFEKPFLKLKDHFSFHLVSLNKKSA